MATTKLLETAIAEALKLPEPAQDALAVAMLNISDLHEPVELDDETRAAIRDGIDQARRGETATDEEIERLFRRYGA